MTKIRVAVISLLSLLITAGAQAGNIIPTHWTAGLIQGNFGTLRAGSPWGPGSTPSNPLAPIDGAFTPENQQWNNGSFWWDEDPSINAGTVYYTIFLDGSYTLNHFIMQADDNDAYLVEWWDGAAWQTAWNVAAVFTFGLVTRDSGELAPITTDRLRLSATAGDNYFAISEFQAFVPEPASLALLGVGLAGLAAARRRKQ